MVDLSGYSDEEIFALEEGLIGGDYGNVAPEVADTVSEEAMLRQSDLSQLSNTDLFRMEQDILNKQICCIISEMMVVLKQ